MTITKKITNKAAIKNLNERLSISEKTLIEAGYPNDALSLQALRLGIDALEKMPEYKILKKRNTPKSLKKGANNIYICPVCSRKFSEPINEKFCPKCGQAVFVK